MLFNPPKHDKVCDVDGTELYQRADDTAEVQSRRIRVFFEQTSPLIEFYAAVARKSLDGFSNADWHPEQRMTREH